ncbi:MAG: hypothetical protein IT287_07745, partial [Bdellovibrionaceae bacterium]|nr:hypothetical protein [Pseudobdellovibrionaceae bacterium]
SNLKASNDNYYKYHVDTLEMQLHKAGYRMAVLLESLVAKKPTLPTQNLLLRTTILNIIGTSQTDFNADLELDAFTSFRFYSSYEDDAHDECETH